MPFGYCALRGLQTKPLGVDALQGRNRNGRAALTELEQDFSNRLHAPFAAMALELASGAMPFGYCALQVLESRL